MEEWIIGVREKEGNCKPGAMVYLLIDNNQSPRFPGKIEASTNAMQGVFIGGPCLLNELVQQSALLLPISEHIFYGRAHI
ncbi:hypothetical protein QL285_006711 [Trifolium repens]|nr:hypothetical protein QL285_006711 [Trifolium repens]